MLSSSHSPSDGVETGTVQPQPWRWVYSWSCLGSTKEQMSVWKTYAAFKAAWSRQLPRGSRANQGFAWFSWGLLCDTAQVETTTQPWPAEDASTTSAMLMAKGKTWQAHGLLSRSNCIPQGVSQDQSNREGSCSGMRCVATSCCVVLLLRGSRREV